MRLAPEGPQQTSSRATSGGPLVWFTAPGQTNAEMRFH